MSKKVPCTFDDCESRIPVEDFDEDVWLPVFKVSREHMGFFCESHVRDLREGRLGKRYLLTRGEGCEIIIDMEPLPPPEISGEPET